MFYEEFSPEARKTIDQFRQFAEDVKSRKIKEYEVCYSGEPLETSWRPYELWYNKRSLVSFYDFILGIIATNRCFDETSKITKFIHEKNLFLPILQGHSILELSKQYSFIAQ